MQFSENRRFLGNVLLHFAPSIDFDPRGFFPGGRALALLGGHKAVVRPVPIPNTAVKHSLADGSGFIDSARVGSRQSFKKSETINFVSDFYCSGSVARRFRQHLEM